MGIFDDAGFGSVSEFEAGGLIGLVARGFVEVVVGFLTPKSVEDYDCGKECDDEGNKGGGAREVVFETRAEVHRFTPGG